MADQVALVGEHAVALVASVGLLLGRLGHVVRVVVQVLVATEQLLLPAIVVSGSILDIVVIFSRYDSFPLGSLIMNVNVLRDALGVVTNMFLKNQRQSLYVEL